jgi:hypothetical protein
MEMANRVQAAAKSDTTPISVVMALGVDKRIFVSA